MTSSHALGVAYAFVAVTLGVIALILVRAIDRSADETKWFLSFILIVCVTAYLVFAGVAVYHLLLR